MPSGISHSFSSSSLHTYCMPGTVLGLKGCVQTVCLEERWASDLYQLSVWFWEESK